MHHTMTRCVIRSLKNVLLGSQHTGPSWKLFLTNCVSSTQLPLMTSLMGQDVRSKRSIAPRG